MESIKFYIGQESGIVVEKDNFASSIFAEQYKQAFEIFNHIWEAQEKVDFRNASNIIAFCGDRGEGKTSLLSSVRTILSEELARKNAVEKLNIDITPSCNSLKALDLLDPLFFDKNHNLIELLLGLMVAEIIKVDREKDAENKVLFDRRNDLLKKFESAKRRLKILSKDSRQEEYDELENLDDLAASIKLREELDSLFQDYAKYYKAEKLIISLDDIDLNMTEGFQMVEQIRKYLSGLHSCILLVALKVDQMERLVMSSMRQCLNAMVPDEVIKDMARRYITKLLPLSSQVVMPAGTEIAERDLIIVDRNAKEHKVGIVKEAIVNLIYQKTRFIFVNGRGLSPIVPTNLRDLRHLIGELWELPDVEKTKKEQHIVNKTTFKQYFFYTWTKCLPEDFQKSVLDIVAHEDNVSLNKLVISYIANFEKIKEVINGTDKESSNTSELTLLDRVLSPANTVYNVSLGDVYYVIQQIEQKLTDKDVRNLFFFIKAFYSIKLYESYDDISVDWEHYFPEKKEDTLSIYRFDEQLQQENILQRLVNGSYFTYNPGDVLPSSIKDKKLYSRDKKNVDVKRLRECFKDLDKYNYEDPITQINPEFLNILHLCEFFALTTTYAKNYSNLTKDYDRSQYDPMYLQEYDSNTNYLAFDVLSIFANMINIKAAYQKFNEILGTTNAFDLYAIAKVVPESLLNQMIKECKTRNSGNTKDKDFKDMHILISDSIIRFSEVQQSIMEMAKTLRNKRKESGNAHNMRLLYDKICNIGITLYPINLKEKGHNLKFMFLNPICDFLKENANEDKGDSLNFDSMFCHDIEVASENPKTRISTSKMPKADASSKNARSVSKEKTKNS